LSGIIKLKKFNTMSAILTIASGTIDTLLAYAGQLFTDTTPFIALAVGLPVAFWVINKAIGLVAGRTKSR